MRVDDVHVTPAAEQFVRDGVQHDVSWMGRNQVVIERQAHVPVHRKPL
jgi:hypothetical protein